jgi:hypothetical protein
VAVNGQGLSDAVRLSEHHIQGSARGASMGNAFGALGGDITSLSINPAGLGVYRASDASFTLAVGETGSTVDYLGSKSRKGDFRMTMPSASYIAALPSTNSGALVGLNFGFGMTQMNDFRIKRVAQASNATSSMLDLFVNNANLGQAYISSFYEALAMDLWDANDNQETLIYNSYINDNGDNVQLDGYHHDMFENTINWVNKPHHQKKNFTEKGYDNEVTFSMGLNFNHRFYAGLTFGVHDLYYESTTWLFETDDNGIIDYFNDYSFQSHLRTYGTAYNLKLGMIFKPINALRLGIAFHTPTWYKLSDSYDNYMDASFDYDPQNIFWNQSPIGEYDYNFRTPSKGIFSAAYVGNWGLVSIDCELLNYGNSRFSDDGGYLDSSNRDISEALRTACNIHVGSEFLLPASISARIGLEYYGSPYKSEAYGLTQLNKDAKTFVYAAGLGWKSGIGLYVDFAFRTTQKTYYANLYDVPVDALNELNYSNPAAKFKDFQNMGVLTLGFRF